jgi:hypothetical protein
MAFRFPPACDAARGAVFWIAVPPGERGYERFPYLLAALCDLGHGAAVPVLAAVGVLRFGLPFARGPRLLRRALAPFGISALQVAAWHFYDSDPENDAYLKKLIEACHREGIQVYAWLEMPHVSEKFWADHPEWREKTASCRMPNSIGASS